MEWLEDLIIPSMGKLIAVVGASGVGKTAFVNALAKAAPFATAYEDHKTRPFQALFKKDSRYALANQIDYCLVRAEQEKSLRASEQIGLIDGGLDLDLYGFTRLFRSRGLLSDAEFQLCRRAYTLLREFLPLPELFVRLYAPDLTVARRLARRDRINIADQADTALFNSFLDEWLASLPPHRVLLLDVSEETLAFEQSIAVVLDRIRTSNSSLLS
jgi:deoxyadenosine/deoxycytidine kinase